jgi:hypothetical protein
MSEESEEPKYIVCSKCHCKYINDDENIKRYFGYKRIGDRYRTCIKCRTRKLVVSSSSTDTPFIEFTKNSDCLITCSNPCNAIHAIPCKNYCKRVYDIKYNPFLNEKDIINTCNEYGYNTIELPSSFELCYRGQKVLDDIYDSLTNSKSMCIFKYDSSCEVVEQFIEGLDGQGYLKSHVKDNCIVVCFIQGRILVSLVMEFVNAFEYMFANLKLQHPRRCTICYEKSRQRKVCFRCKKDICTDCFMCLNKLTCPNCSYNITDHSIYMERLYEIKE